MNHNFLKLGWGAFPNSNPESYSFGMTGIATSKDGYEYEILCPTLRRKYTGTIDSPEHLLAIMHALGIENDMP